MNTLVTLASAGGPLVAGWGAHASLLGRRVRAARRDGLTGLPTREEFTRTAARLLRHPLTAVVLVDLDGFKAVNDTAGHAAGDAILTATAARLAALASRGGMAARLGGDEFALIRPVHALPWVLPEVHRRLTEPVPFEGRTLAVGASVGAVAVRALPASDVASALRAADEAMYAAKRAGGGWRVADPTGPQVPTVNGRRAGRNGTHTTGTAGAAVAAELPEGSGHQW